MPAVLIRARAELRQRWRALVSISILTGLFGALVLATLAGARRTEQAYPAFLERQRAWDVIVPDSTLFSDVFWKPDFERIAKLPYVRASAPIVLGGFDNYGTFMTGTDERFGTTLQRYKAVRGRLPRSDRPDEVAAPYFADGEIGALKVGDRITLQAGNGSIPVTVVGETVAPGEFPPSPQFGWGLYVSPAFVREHREKLGFALPGLALRFEQRNDIERFERDVRAMTGGKVLAPMDQESHASAVRGSTELQVGALRILAIFTALTALLIMGQALSRETSLASEEAPTLRALGFGRNQLLALGILRIVPVAIGGTLVAVVSAWLASPIFPQGSIRLADASTGLQFDVLVLGVGAAFLAAGVLLAVLVPAWLAAASAGRSEVAPARASRITALTSHARLPVSAIAGVRLALERGRGRTAVPVVSSLLIVSLGIGSFVAAMTFSKSLDAMVNDPRLYGKTWDGVVDLADDEDVRYDTLEAARAIASDPGVKAAAVADSGAPLKFFSPDGPSRGISVLGLFLFDLKGSLFPTVVEGRVPRNGHEVALGARMIRALGVELDPDHPPIVQMALEGSDRRVDVRVVGRAVIPPLGNYGQFGFGVAFNDDDAILEIVKSGDEPPPITDMLVRWNPGADQDAVLARARTRFPDVRPSGELFSGRVADVVNFGGVEGAPWFVGGMLAMLGVAALAHVVITAIRRRRRDIAILKTLGLVRGQARRAVAWQSTVSVVIAAAFGIPLGVAAGRWLWIRVADGIGVIPAVRLEWWLLGLMVPALIVIANAIAAIPARAAANTQPALVLRSD